MLQKQGTKEKGKGTVKGKERRKKKKGKGNKKGAKRERDAHLPRSEMRIY
jgi:hypothetical protein